MQYIFFPHKAVCTVRTYKFMDVLHAYYLLTWMDIRYVCMHLWMYVYYALTWTYHYMYALREFITL